LPQIFIVTLSILKKFFIFLSKRPCNLDNNYDLENYGVIDNDEECFYDVIIELWPIGEKTPNELNFLPKILCGTT
jgi:hypothetical protein